MCWINGQSPGRKNEAMWMAFACQHSESLRLNFPGLSTDKKRSSVPTQKKATIRYKHLYSRESFEICASTNEAKFYGLGVKESKPKGCKCIMFPMLKD